MCVRIGEKISHLEVGGRGGGHQKWLTPAPLGRHMHPQINTQTNQLNKYESRVHCSMHVVRNTTILLSNLLIEILLAITTHLDEAAPPLHVMQTSNSELTFSQ